MDLFFDEDDLNEFYKQRRRMRRPDGDGEERNDDVDGHQERDEQAEQDLLQAKEILEDNASDLIPNVNSTEDLLLLPNHHSINMTDPDNSITPMSPMTPPTLLSGGVGGGGHFSTATSSIKSSSNSSGAGVGPAVGIKKNRSNNTLTENKSKNVPSSPTKTNNNSVLKQNGSFRARKFRKTRKTSPKRPDPEVSSSASSDLPALVTSKNKNNDVEVGANEVENENDDNDVPDENEKYLSGFSSLSERCLGRRTVFYLKSEAMVGRITRHRIQTLASVMGVSSSVHIELSRKRIEEAEDRFRIMGEVIEAWCAKPSVRHKSATASVAGICGALDQARLTYHAGAIRAMTGVEGTPSSPSKALPSSSEAAMSSSKQAANNKAGSPTRQLRNRRNNNMTNTANGHHPASGATSRYNFNFYRDSGAGNTSISSGTRRVGVGGSGGSSRRSDGGTESDNNSSSHNSHKASREEEDEEEATPKLIPDSPTKKLRRKPKYTFDGRVQKSPTKKKPPESLKDERKASDDTSESYLIDYDEDKYDSSRRDRSPAKYNSQSPKKKQKEVPSRLPIGARSPTKSKKSPIAPPEHDSMFSSDSDRPRRLLPTRRRNQDLLLLNDDFDSSRRGSSTSPVKQKKGLNNYRPKNHSDDNSSRYSSRDSKTSGGSLDAVQSKRPARSRSRPKTLRPEDDDDRKSYGQKERPFRSNEEVGTKSPKKLRKLPGSPQKRNRSVSPTKSAKNALNNVGSNSRLNTAGSGGMSGNNGNNNAEIIASPTKNRYYYSKYGTWKELQRISQANMKTKPEEVDNLDSDVRSVVSKLEYVSERERSDYSEAIATKIRGDRFLSSLCRHLPDYLHCAVSVLASFGTDSTSHVVLGSRTQILVWYTLERLRRFWLASGDPIPEGHDILRHKDTMDFLSSVTKLCYNVSHNEQIVVTSVVEKDRRHNKIWLNFKQFGVKLLRSRLENFGIVKFHDRGPFLTEAGHFLEVRFRESLFVDFLGSVHVHVAQEDVRDFSKDKLVACLPFFCGLSSKEESSKGQKMVVQFLDGLSGGIPRPREPDFYLSALQRVWLESQQAWLSGVYEGKLKNIYIYPPPGDRQIVLALSKIPMHELLPLAYYLDNIDPKHVQLEGLYMTDCGLDDEALRMLGRNLFKITKVQLTGNYFTSKGIHDITRGARDKDYRIRSLEMSDSNFNDDCLERLVPILPSLEELVLADNFLTWYGIRKITQPQKKTKRLKRMDLSRCSLNEHAFYELIPLILKTEQVILEGNRFSPLELKIFARQVRENEKSKLDTLILTNCQLDDVCLYEIAKFAFKIPNLVLQGGNFSSEGLRHLAKYCRKHEWEKIRSLNLRGCKLTSECLSDLGELAPGLETLNISYNNFSGADVGVKAFAAALAEGTSGGKRIRFVDLRHCRLSDASKRALGDIGRREKIEFKMW